MKIYSVAILILFLSINKTFSMGGHKPNPMCRSAAEEITGIDLSREKTPKISTGEFIRQLNGISQRLIGANDASSIDKIIKSLLKKLI